MSCSIAFVKTNDKGNEKSSNEKESRGIHKLTQAKRLWNINVKVDEYSPRLYTRSAK
jgi:hypothetical protein